MSRKVINVVANRKGNSIEYLVPPFDNTLMGVFMYTAYLAKGSKDNEIAIVPLLFVSQMGFVDLLGVAILPDILVYVEGRELKTVKELIISVIGEEAYNALPRMTEEEFYAIP